MAPLLNGTKSEMVNPDERVTGRNSERFGFDVDYSANGKLNWRRVYASDEQHAKDMILRSHICLVIFFSVKPAK